MGILNSESAEPPKKKQKTAAKKPAKAPSKGSAGKSGVSKAQAGMMTRKEFEKAAKSIEATVGDQKITVAAKNFSTGSCGWFFSQKLPIKIGNETATATYQVMMTVVGSKQW